MTTRAPDFTFNLAIPVYYPTPEEVARMPQPEDHIQKLVEVGFMTIEEAYSFLIFSGLASGIPSMVTEFLTEYRASKVRSELVESVDG